jgi:hypothetical protein
MFLVISALISATRSSAHAGVAISGSSGSGRRPFICLAAP